MGWKQRIDDLMPKMLSKVPGRIAAFDGTTGPPPSGNGASSFHLFWDAPPGHWVGAEATIEILEAPAVAKLYFWAMQVGFADGSHSTGAGHIGPQWFSTDPRRAAINWGGYGADGHELDGTVSPLPSASGNVNTRDFGWEPRHPYRLRVVRAPDPGRDESTRTAWRGSVIDLTTGEETFIRELFAPGDRIESPMVWSEVFAACDDPPVTVRWSDLAMIGGDGTRAPVTTASVNYQGRADGGCDNTTIEVAQDGAGFLQRTNTSRQHPPGARLRLVNR